MAKDRGLILIKQEDFDCGPCNIVCEIHRELNVLYVTQVLESFKIMDYSLLLGVHVLDQSHREGDANIVDGKRTVGQKVLYSTAMESIQGDGKAAEALTTDDTWVPDSKTSVYPVMFILFLYIYIYIYIYIYFTLTSHFIRYTCSIAW